MTWPFIILGVVSAELLMFGLMRYQVYLTDRRDRITRLRLMGRVG